MPLPPPPPPMIGQIKPVVSTSSVLLTPLRKEIQNYSQVKLKNFQWKKLDPRVAEKTIWDMDHEEDVHMEETLKVEGAFQKIEALFPAKVNTFLEGKKFANQKAEIKNDSIKFLSSDKNRNISK